MNSPFTTIFKIFAGIALIALIVGLMWGVTINEDKSARKQELQTRCQIAYDNDERVSKVMKACQKDSTLTHYEDVEGFFTVTFLVAGMAALASIRNS